MEQMLISTTAYMGLCFAMTVLWRIPYAFAPLFTLAFLGLGGFAAAACAQWHVFAKVSTYLGLAAFIPFAVLFFRQKNQQDARVLCLIHTGIQFFSVWYYYGAKLRYFDEFYWATLSHDFFRTGTLLNAISPIMESGVPKVHPPLMALWQGFFSTTVWGEPVFQEGSIGLASFTLLMALFCLVVYLCREHMPLVHALAVACLAVCLVRLLGTNVRDGLYVMGYAENYQAALLSLGLCLSCFLLRSPLQIVALLVTVLLLTMSKATSYLFVLSIVAVYTTVAVCRYGEEKRHRPNAPCGKNLRASLAVCMLLLVATVAIHTAWVMHIHAEQQLFAQNQLAQNQQKTQESQKESVKKQTTQMQREGASSASVPMNVGIMTHGNSVMERFSSISWAVLPVWLWGMLELPLLHSPMIPASYMVIFFTFLPLYMYPLCMGGASIFFFKTSYKKEDMAVFVLLSGGLVAWFFLRFIIASLWHSPEELYRVASYARYMSAFFAPVLVYMTLVFHIRIGYAYVRNAWIYYAFLFFFPVSLMLLGNFSPWHPPREVSAQENRLSMERATAYLQAHTPLGARIWFIMQEDDKEAFSAMRYLTFPQYRTDLRLPCLVPTQEGILSLDALFPRAKKTNVDYILLWNEQQNIRYRLGEQVYESAGQPVLIPLKKEAL